MNVLVTLNSLVLGGCPLNAVDLAVTAEAHGVHSLVVGFRESMPVEGPSMVDVARERGAELVVLDTPMRTSTSAPALADLADRQAIDLVHGYGGWDLRPAFLGPARWGRRPLVQTVYEMYVPTAVYPRSPLIVGTGYLLDEQRRTHRGLVELISPPVDLATDTPDHDAGPFLGEFCDDLSRLRVVIVSRLASDMKEVGIRQAIEALPLLDSADVDLLIVGTGDAEARLRAVGHAVNEQLGRRAVVFCGPMHDPRSAYAAADIVIGMGSSAARALAFAKPLIVCGEHGWFRTFTPESSSMLFRNSFWSDESEDDAVASLAGQVRQLRESAVLRSELGSFGRMFAESSFGLSAMAERMVAYYERALLRHRRRSWFFDLPREAQPGVAWVRRRLEAVRS
jgi:glycosyltransferase involved in cell wall biosynthesis